MTPVLRQRFWLGAALTLTGIKLWLSRGQGVYAIGSAGHDDRLFLELAQHLVHGDWLGPYNELTLAKGPFYSLFIAATFLLGLPLFLAQHAFYAAACGAVVRALRPAIMSGGARFAIFTLLLWNPMTYDGPSMGRVLRQHVYGPLALLILAGLIALYLRRAEPMRRQWPWALLTGLAAGAFYLTREEVVWFAPSVLLLVGAYLFGCGRTSREALRHAAAVLGLVAIAAVMPVLVVSTMNRIHYGWFGTCEFHAAEFRDAYGAMLRVRVGPERPFVPVSREAREVMTSASPAFAELQQHFNAGLAQGWASASESVTKIPAAEGQIGGGWLVWAFREAAAKAGHYGSAAEAMSFYGRLARELNQACDRGQLPAGPPRSGFLPPWQAGQTPAFVRATRTFADFVIRFSRFSGRPLPSTGSLEELQLFRDLTRERLSPPAGELDVVGAARYVLNVRKTDTLHVIGKALRPVLIVLFYLALAIAVVRVGWLVLRRRWSFPLTVAAAAFGACAASVLLHAMIEASSFPVHTISSFAPVYPLLLVFIAATFWEAGAAFLARHNVVTAPEAGPADPAPGSTSTSRLSRLIPWLGALAALLPYLLWHRSFGELFWFGDELFLLDQLTILTFTQWVTQGFSENFVPVFKLLWGGAVFGFGGSYIAMLWLVWLTHALNTLLLGGILLRAGFSLIATLAVQLVFCLPASNIETLGWTVQWSAMLAVTFLLLGLWWHGRHGPADRILTWRLHLPLMLCSAASACSFSRGVATGGVLTAALLAPAVIALDWRTLHRYLPGALFCLIPSAAVAAFIKLNSTGLHQQLAGHWGEVIEYGLSYFLLNPGHALSGGPLHPAVIVLQAVAKLGLIAAGFWCARGALRPVLVVFLAYDAGSALLLGFGRYDAGFVTAMSSRYQYSSLVATLPFAAVLLEAGLARLPAGRIRLGFATAVLVVAAGLCLRGWSAELREFTGWRGTEMRQLMSAPATSDPAVHVPALDFMHIERAKALQRAYHLH